MVTHFNDACPSLVTTPPAKHCVCPPDSTLFRHLIMSTKKSACDLMKIVLKRNFDLDKENKQKSGKVTMWNVDC